MWLLLDYCIGANYYLFFYQDIMPGLHQDFEGSILYVLLV